MLGRTVPQDLLCSLPQCRGGTFLSEKSTAFAAEFVFSASFRRQCFGGEQSHQSEVAALATLHGTHHIVNCLQVPTPLGVHSCHLSGQNWNPGVQGAPKVCICRNHHHYHSALSAFLMRPTHLSVLKGPHALILLLHITHYEMLITYCELHYLASVWITQHSNLLENKFMICYCHPCSDESFAQ